MSAKKSPWTKVYNSVNRNSIPGQSPGKLSKLKAKLRSLDLMSCTDALVTFRAASRLSRHIKGTCEGYLSISEKAIGDFHLTGEIVKGWLSKPTRGSNIVCIPIDMSFAIAVRLAHQQDLS